ATPSRLRGPVRGGWCLRRAGGVLGPWGGLFQRGPPPAAAATPATFHGVFGHLAFFGQPPKCEVAHTSLRSRMSSSDRQRRHARRLSRSGRNTIMLPIDFYFDFASP